VVVRALCLRPPPVRWVGEFVAIAPSSGAGYQYTGRGAVDRTGAGPAVRLARPKAQRAARHGDEASAAPNITDATPA
jgi:hypothetical protein